MRQTYVNIVVICRSYVSLIAFRFIGGNSEYFNVNIWNENKNTMNICDNQRIENIE